MPLGCAVLPDPTLAWFRGYRKASTVHISLGDVHAVISPRPGSQPERTRQMGDPIEPPGRWITSSRPADEVAHLRASEDQPAINPCRPQPRHCATRNGWRGVTNRRRRRRHLSQGHSSLRWAVPGGDSRTRAQVRAGVPRC